MSVFFFIFYWTLYHVAKNRLGSGGMPSRPQTVTWTSDVPVLWRHVASLRHNVLHYQGEIFKFNEIYENEIIHVTERNMKHIICELKHLLLCAWFNIWEVFNCDLKDDLDRISGIIYIKYYIKYCMNCSRVVFEETMAPSHLHFSKSVVTGRCGRCEKQWPFAWEISSQHGQIAPKYLYKISHSLWRHQRV